MADTEHQRRTVVVIACGGTGGHLFPGIAVGQELLRRDCVVTVMVSPKDVDQQAIRSITDMNVVTLPAVGLERGGLVGFASGFLKSYHKAKKLFAARPPQLALAMGGFISAPPMTAAKRFGAATFLHESNTVPGKANRWLARWVDGAFVYFQQAAGRLKAPRVETVGMPVRPQFLQPLRPSAARTALGLEPDKPTVLIMGGSQGASAINDLTLAALAKLRREAPELQFIHLTGERDAAKAQAAHAAAGGLSLVRAFMNEMGLALAAADVAVSRAGASSLAELAARQVPAVLIPYPSAANDHQHHNARAFVDTGAARLLRQRGATPDMLAAEILTLLLDANGRTAMRKALGNWRRDDAAAEIAERILHWRERQRMDAAPSSGFNGANIGALNV